MSFFLWRYSKYWNLIPQKVSIQLDFFSLMTSGYWYLLVYFKRTMQIFCECIFNLLLSSGISDVYYRNVNAMNSSTILSRIRKASKAFSFLFCKLYGLDYLHVYFSTAFVHSWHSILQHQTNLQLHWFVSSTIW